jgi:hypothetical protein
MILVLGLFTIGLTLLGLGLLYAYYIYRAPIDRTWVEVVIGVAGTITGEMMALAIVLVYYGLLYQLWWIIPFPAIAFALTGIPMAAFQEWKYRTQKQKAEYTKNEHNGK